MSSLSLETTRPPDTRWAEALLAALRRRDMIAEVVRDYAARGIAGTEPDLEHRRMLHEARDEVAALWNKNYCLQTREEV